MHVRCLHYGFSMCGGFTVHTCIYCPCSTCTLHTTRVPCTQHVYCTCVSPADYTDTRRCSMKVSAKVYTCLHTTRVRLHVSADYTRVLGDCRRRCSCWSRDPVPAPRLHCSALSAAARPAQSWPDRAGGGCCASVPTPDITRLHQPVSRLHIRDYNRCRVKMCCRL